MKTTSTKPSTSGGSLADFDECEVLNSLAPQLGLTEIEPGIGGSCHARLSATVSVTIKGHPELGLTDLNISKGEVSDTTVGSRKARLLKGSTTNVTCLIAMMIGSIN